MDYKKVRRSHVVPRGYQRGFADGELIEMHLVDVVGSRVVPVGRAGVVKDAYLRHRPRDGTPIHDVEWSLEHIDRVAPRLLRGIAEHWPLTLENKVTVGEFVAIQMLRGPRWRDWHHEYTVRALADYHDSGLLERYVVPGVSVEEARRRAEEGLTSDTAALTKMLGLSRKVASILTSMHWALVEFPQPMLATSDHPVVVWPLGVRSLQPKKSADFTRSGILNSLEVRFPVTAHHALLLTWRDLPDDDALRISGSRDVAANINAFTIAEAERQWLHRPAAAVPRASGQLLALSARLAPRYDSAAAELSERRREISWRVNAMSPEAALRGGFDVVTVLSDGRIDVVRVAAPKTAEDAA